jgi:restriction system protein
MTIPDFQSIMLPLLEHLSDGKEHLNQETLDALAQRFGLSDEELTELLPSGTQTVFVNRVAWAKTHMKMAGLLDAPKRAVYQITNCGRELLASNPQTINMNTLMEYPEYVEFRTRKRKGKKPEHPTYDAGGSGGDELTPEEQLDVAYGRIRQQLSQELLEKVMASPPHFFERLVVELLVAMGYGGSRQDAGRTIGRSGDGGVDGVIKEDRLGLDAVYVQAKRWEGTVGRPEIQKFAGALQGQRAKKGVFITTSSFSKEAEDYVERIENKIVLIDGERLTDLMIDFGIGVSRVERYDIKRLDSDYFEEP